MFKKLMRIGLVIAAMAIWLADAAHATQLIYFTESPRGLYNFDTDTGLSTLRCSMTGTERFFGMDRQPSDGKVFAVDLWSSGLWTINTENGATNLIGTLTPAVDRPEGITFNPQTGDLYVASVKGELYKVDPATAAATLVGQSNLTIRGHSFMPDGSAMLAVREGASGLFKVDPATANATYIGPGITTTTAPEDTTFALDGQFYGTDYKGKIYRLNPQTGAATFLGNTGHGDRLLGLIAVPEPSTLALLGMGIVGLFTFAYRRFSTTLEAAGKDLMLLWCTLLAASYLAGPLSPAKAAITSTGDVLPSSPSTWGPATSGYIGKTSSGTVTVDGGYHLISSYGYLGYSSGASGLVTIAGAGSTWTNNSDLYVGISGIGTLNISNGGGVGCSRGYIGYGYSPGSASTATVDGAGSTWTNSGVLYVGDDGTGTLIITNGGTVGDSTGCIGRGNYGAGTATVDGAGSKWIHGSNVIIGEYGRGTLNVLSGGAVSSPIGSIGYFSGSSGTVTVDDPGSIWTNDRELFVGISGKGTLNITNGGTVSCSYGCIAYYSYSSSNTVTVDGAGSKWINSGKIDVGCSGSGAVMITNCGAVSSSSGNIGYIPGASGTVTVDGAGSIWSNSGDLSVGAGGSGMLKIVNGGNVSNSAGYIGYYSASRGTAAVDGVGSTWTSTGDLYVGKSGAATLSITGQGAVTAKSVSVNSASLLALDVGRGSSLTIVDGAGTFTNHGTLRILAGAGVPVNDSVNYSPISAGTWSGSGSCQPVGGTWDTTSHMFMASRVTPGVSGSSVPLNLASVQRALISYAGSDDEDWAVGASFPAAASETDITFTATAINDGVFNALERRLENDQEILSGWTFSTTGYSVSSSNPIYLSFEVGSGQSLDALDLWIYKSDYLGGYWSAYTATDLTYDGTYASFTATTLTTLTGFAVSGVPVPEPCCLAMLLPVTLGGLLFWRRRAWLVQDR